MGLPFYKYYPADIDIDTGHLTAEQFGAYQRLLNASWTREGLPTDLAQLALVARVAEKRFVERVWPAIEGFWSVNGSGLVNRRQEREREAALESHQRRVEAGRKGGSTKA
jgi:uncharacterized protein YdaU (DUF1376 family)